MMNTQPLSTYHPTLAIELTAEEVPQTALSRMRQALKYRLKRADTLALRVALPPLLVWAVLYSLVEFLI